ncbi:hypothetical protein BVE86_09455 [Streptococcus azizii]|uniref:Uncharacterized protein n=1 Tax=Streptococcus azizii TaxID=1579424 RepID=A0AB36JNC7_9STRE|nr:hypothetical protein BVE86_09455 [Streptococcus azizii]
MGTVNDRWTTPILYLTEDNDDMARTLFVRHLSNRKAKEVERHQREIEKIEKLVTLVDNSPVMMEEENG